MSLKKIFKKALDLDGAVTVTILHHKFIINAVFYTNVLKTFEKMTVQCAFVVIRLMEIMVG